MRPFSNILQTKRQIPIERAEKAAQRSTWQDLGLRIDEENLFTKENIPKNALTPNAKLPVQQETARNDFSKRGIGTFIQLLPPKILQEVLGVVEKVESAGWPQVFAFADDRLWHLLARPELKEALAPLLGGAPQQLPGIWVHQVQKGEHGWEPHVDVSGKPIFVKDGVDRLTAWLPLTPATCENGCIFAVPYSHEQDLMHHFDEVKEIPLNDVIRLLHKACALESLPGDVLIWRFQTLHWGGPSSPHAAQKRVSLSFEFGHVDVPPHTSLAPSWPLGAIPSFETRLFLIARSVLMYGQDRHRAPVASRFINVATALLDLCSP